MVSEVTNSVGSQSGQVGKKEHDVNSTIENLTKMFIGIFGKAPVNNHYYDGTPENDASKYFFWFLGVVLVLGILFFLFGRNKDNKKRN